MISLEVAAVLIAVSCMGALRVCARFNARVYICVFRYERGATSSDERVVVGGQRGRSAHCGRVLATKQPAGGRVDAHQLVESSALWLCRPIQQKHVSGRCL